VVFLIGLRLSLIFPEISDRWMAFDWSLDIGHAAKESSHQVSWTVRCLADVGIVISSVRTRDKH
jgi:hypothetical protein